jgi:PGAP1-like protein
MTSTTRGHLSDLLGATRLAAGATAGLADAVEAMHLTVQRVRWIVGAPVEGSTRGVTGLVYQSIRGVARLVDVAACALVALAPDAGAGSSERREAMLAALNGIVGDHLAATGNPLAIPMCLRRNGRLLDVTARGLAASLRAPRRKVLVLVHGACHNDLQWRRHGHDHGAALARALGYTQVHLRYNTGLHVSTNGRAFAALLEKLVERWPVEVDELAIVAHSMGGLVARSACHYGEAAGHRWVGRLRHLVFLGTPHHGAPLERGGNGLASLLQLSPYAAPIARLGRLRSAGVTDLRFGNVLDEDWSERDRFARAPDGRRPVPLPKGVACYAIAATLGLGAIVGDGIVPVDSALGRHPDPARALEFPARRRWVARGLGHFDLLSRPEVCAQIRAWLAGAETTSRVARRRARTPRRP